MILFYNKKTGKIIGSVLGRVHDSNQMGMEISNKENPKEDVEKYVIGWEQTNELEDCEVEVLTLEEMSDGLFKRVKKMEKQKRSKIIEHNMDKFPLLQRFEDDTPENPMDYKVDIETNNLIKVDKQA